MPLIVVSHPDRVTEVKTNIYVTSFGPVSDTDMVRADIGHLFIVVNYSPISLLLYKHLDNNTIPGDGLVLPVHT